MKVTQAAVAAVTAGTASEGVARRANLKDAKRIRERAIQADERYELKHAGVTQRGYRSCEGGTAKLRAVQTCIRHLKSRLVAIAQPIQALRVAVTTDTAWGFV